VTRIVKPKPITELEVPMGVDVSQYANSNISFKHVPSATHAHTLAHVVNVAIHQSVDAAARATANTDFVCDLGSQYVYPSQDPTKTWFCNWLTTPRDEVSFYSQFTNPSNNVCNHKLRRCSELKQFRVFTCYDSVYYDPDFFSDWLNNTAEDALMFFTAWVFDANDQFGYSDDLVMTCHQNHVTVSEKNDPGFSLTQFVKYEHPNFHPAINMSEFIIATNEKSHVSVVDLWAVGKQHVFLAVKLPGSKPVSSKFIYSDIAGFVQSDYNNIVLNTQDKRINTLVPGYQLHDASLVRKDLDYYVTFGTSEVNLSQAMVSDYANEFFVSQPKDNAEACAMILTKRNRITNISPEQWAAAAPYLAALSMAKASRMRSLTNALDMPFYLRWWHRISSSPTLLAVKTAYSWFSSHKFYCLAAVGAAYLAYKLRLLRVAKTVLAESVRAVLLPGNMFQLISGYVPPPLKQLVPKLELPKVNGPLLLTSLVLENMLKHLTSFGSLIPLAEAILTPRDQLLNYLPTALMHIATLFLPTPLAISLHVLWDMATVGSTMLQPGSLLSKLASNPRVAHSFCVGKIAPKTGDQLTWKVCAPIPCQHDKPDILQIGPVFGDDHSVVVPSMFTACSVNLASAINLRLGKEQFKMDPNCIPLLKKAFIRLTQQYGLPDLSTPVSLSYYLEGKPSKVKLKLEKAWNELQGQEVFTDNAHNGIFVKRELKASSAEVKITGDYDSLLYKYTGGKPRMIIDFDAKLVAIFGRYFIKLDEWCAKIPYFGKCLSWEQLDAAVEKLQPNASGDMGSFDASFQPGHTELESWILETCNMPKDLVDLYRRIASHWSAKTRDRDLAFSIISCRPSGSFSTSTFNNLMSVLVHLAASLKRIADAYFGSDYRFDEKFYQNDKLEMLARRAQYLELTNFLVNGDDCLFNVDEDHATSSDYAWFGFDFEIDVIHEVDYCRSYALVVFDDVGQHVHMLRHLSEVFLRATWTKNLQTNASIPLICSLSLLVSECSILISRGVPVYESFYRNIHRLALARLGDTPRRELELECLPSYTLRQFIINSGITTHELAKVIFPTTEIDRRTRFSFYMLTGLAPVDQIDVELQFDRLNDLFGKITNAPLNMLLRDLSASEIATGYGAKVRKL